MKTKNQNMKMSKVLMLGAAIFAIGVMTACGAEEETETTDNEMEVDSTETEIEVEDVETDSVNYEADSVSSDVDAVESVTE